jgi:quinoprotein glucose dehydrogenase
MPFCLRFLWLLCGFGLPFGWQGLAADFSDHDPWGLEAESKRAALSLYQTVPAATLSDLTNASPTTLPPGVAEGDWHRSHGNHASDRYSTLKQIHRDNVSDLEVAWVYHSNDGKGNIQCNPISVDGTIYAPTVGGHVVALDGSSGVEKWRFKPEGQPAFRGLTWWGGAADGKTRLMFNAGDWLYLLHPESGQPFESFGDHGRVRTGHFRVAPAIHENRILIAGYDGDAFAFDLFTGEKQWTFHTKPEPGTFGSDT